MASDEQSSDLLADEPYQSDTSVVIEQPRSNSKRSYWFGTINNYTITEVNKLKFMETGYTVIGMERAPTTGTKHIHFVLYFDRGHQRSFKNIKQALPRCDLNYFDQKDYGKKVAYCKKDGNFFESGSHTPNVKAERRDAQQRGQQELFASFQALARAGKGYEISADYYTRYWAYYDKLARDGVVERASIAAAAAIPQHELHEWQHVLEEYLHSNPTREIYWVYDSDGGGGKTWFAEWYCAMEHHDAEIVLPGKAADMAHALTPGKRVYLFDVPRVSGDKVAWGFIEQLKNGRIFSSKYQSNTIHMRVPHVVIFSNAAPPTVTDTTGFTERKIKLVTLTAFNFTNYLNQ